MGFKEIENIIKRVYDSDEDDVLNDFYIPILGETSKYLRLAGFFSSSALAAAAKGLQGLIENNGTMKIVCSCYLSKKDVNAIEKGLKEPEKVIEEFALTQINDIKSEFEKDHFSALAWLIAQNKLEIKIAIVPEKGLFHMKIGIFEDDDGNRISFSGSINETADAYEDHVENFIIFKEWESGQEEVFFEHLQKWEKFWNNKAKRTIVYEVPDVIKEEIIKYRPKNIHELKSKLNKWSKPLLIKKTDKKKQILKPWDHQIKAINRFKQENYNGILKMATGTGKTYNALFCLKEYFKNVQRYWNRILIIVPQHNILEQWINDLKELKEDEDIVLKYDSKTRDKDKKNARNMWRHQFNLSDKFNIYLVIVAASIPSFKPFLKISPHILIGDEVHSYGTENYSNIVNRYLSDTQYKLGLSATPERYYDEDGTLRIFDFFGPIIFEYGIKDGQKDNILSKYYYYPYIVELTPFEEELVEELTKRIGKQYAIDYQKEISEKETKNKKIEWNLHERAKIIKKSSSKYDVLRKILKENKDKLKQCIVYCEDSDQLARAEEVFKELNIDTYIKYHAKIKKRETALNLFKEKNVNFILSMHCLDQGVNIPSCDSLILLSSSGNPREYIQRRGRVIRNPVNKIKPSVKIFDILAFPKNVKNMYRGLIITQVVRSWEFIDCSESPEAKIILEPIFENYDITHEELDSITKEWK